MYVFEGKYLMYDGSVFVSTVMWKLLSCAVQVFCVLFDFLQLWYKVMTAQCPATFYWWIL